MHGSIDIIVNEQRFDFSSPERIGSFARYVAELAGVKDENKLVFAPAPDPSAPGRYVIDAKGHWVLTHSQGQAVTLSYAFAGNDNVHLKTLKGDMVCAGVVAPSGEFIRRRALRPGMQHTECRFGS